VERYFKSRDEASRQEAIDMVLNSDIIEECYQTAREYCTAALRNLDKLPDTPARRSLADLAEFVIAQGT
jgi:geranylgeranyl pyrophosphate synthase